VRPLYETNLAAGLVLGVAVLVWVVAEVRQSQRTRSDATETDAGSRQLLRITIGAGWFLAFISVNRFPEATIRSGRVASYIVGVALVWVGAGLRLWAFQTLGRYFTFSVMTSADQKVVTAGPYRLIRHPGYAGGALAMAGVGLAMGNWISAVALTLVPLIGTINRIRVEEAALLAAIGYSYRSYADGRKRLVPYLW